MEKKMAKVSVAPRRPSTPPMERRQPPPRVDGPRDAAWFAKERKHESSECNDFKPSLLIL